MLSRIVSWRRSRLRTAAAFAVLAGLTLIAAGSLSEDRAAQALTNCSASDEALDGEEQAFLGLINAYRVQSGLGTLAVSSNLNRAAAWMTGDLATKNYFSHVDSLGRGPHQRSIQCDYPGEAGENLAAGTFRESAQSAFDAWRSSPGHNANMLYPTYRMIGIARRYDASATYGWYWATSFGLEEDGTNGAAAAAASAPAPAPATGLAELISPAPGSTLPGGKATFTRSSGSGVSAVYLYLGTCQGCADLADGSWPDDSTLTLGNLPAGGTVHIRLWSFVNGAWAAADYAFTVSP